MTTTSATVAWTRLRKTLRERASGEVPTVPTGVETIHGPVRYAIGPTGEPRLLVPCSHDSRLAATDTQKLRVDLNRLQCENTSTLFVDVMCLDPRLESVFAELVSEVIKRVHSGSPPGVAVSGGINDFRDLLRPATSGEVTDETIAGLIGELLILRRLCNEDLGAITAWTGPTSQRHDFRRGNHALEVKTSMRSDRRTVTIHGIDQLSPPSVGTLVLFHVRLERSDQGALSVGQLVTEILSFGVDSIALASALSALGCPDPSDPDWNRVKFGLKGMTAYEVAPEFPAITSSLFPGGVPTGLDNVRYDVNLDLANPFSLDEAGLQAAIKRFLS